MLQGQMRQCYVLCAVCHVPSSRDPGSACWVKASSNDFPVAKSEGLFPRKLSISAQLVWVGVLELQVNSSIWFRLSIPNLSGFGDSCFKLPSGEVAFPLPQGELKRYGQAESCLL